MGLQAQTLQNFKGLGVLGLFYSFSNSLGFCGSFGFSSSLGFSFRRLYEGKQRGGGGP